MDPSAQARQSDDHRPTSAERVERLRSRAEREFPESWVPEQSGDEIAGELLRYTRGTTSYGEQTIAVLRTPDGEERSVWLLHAVLRGEFAKRKPIPGELVLIRYEGRRQSAAGNPYAVYRVEVEREDAPPDWEAIGADAELDVTGAQAPLETPNGSDDDIPF